MSYESVQVVIELGHRAVYLDEPTSEGFTHNWTLFVCGARKHDISHFVDKVVFHLHESFKSPKRVIKRPPYEVSESGYGSFECRIEVYFRNKGDPHKLTFVHDLVLTFDKKSDPAVVARCEKLTFRSPSEEFAKRLLSAGGVVLGEMSSPASDVARSKLTSSSSHRRSSSHASAAATVPAGTGRGSSGSGKPSVNAAAVDQSASSAMKGKNVCVVEPQSANKATAVVAPLVTESRQFTELFGEPIVKSDVPKKHHHHQKDKKRSLLLSEKPCETPATSSQSPVPVTSAVVKDSVVSQSAESADRQRLVQKRLLKASLFGDEDSPMPKKTRQKEAEDLAQMKEKAKAEKVDDGSDRKASKHSIETSENSRRSMSKTPEPTLSKHLDDSGKSTREKHSRPSSDSHHHQSHSKHHKSSHHSSSSTFTKQTMPPLSDGKSAITPLLSQQSAKDDTQPVAVDSSEKRKVCPLKLAKPSLSAAVSSSASTQNHSSAQGAETRNHSSAQGAETRNHSSAQVVETRNHSSAQGVDMKKLFGDDDDDDDDDDVDYVTDAAAAAADDDDVTVMIVKDDARHKEDRHRPADAAKKHVSHGHKKMPDKSRSNKTLPTATAAKGPKDKTDIERPKLDTRCSSRSSDRHHQSESGFEKRSRDAAKSSGKPVATPTKPDSVATTVTDSKSTTLSDAAAKSSKVSDAVSNKKREEEVGECAADLSLSDSDVNENSESDDVDVCDPQPEKSSSQDNQQHHSDSASHLSRHHQQSASDPATSLELSSLSWEAKAANGEYISVLLDLQKQLMSVADDETLEKLTTMIEETGKYSITDETFDFDLCRLDIHTVNKLKHFFATATC